MKPRMSLIELTQSKEVFGQHKLGNRNGAGSRNPAPLGSAKAQ
jgi:hypothetical protein